VYVPWQGSGMGGRQQNITYFKWLAPSLPLNISPSKASCDNCAFNVSVLPMKIVTQRDVGYRSLSEQIAPSKWAALRLYSVAVCFDVGVLCCQINDECD
jgi:hypothetical protein